MVWSSDVCSSDLCTALEDDQPALVRFARAAFASYFDRRENLDDPAVLIAVADAEGLDGGAIAEAAVSDVVKARLRANTGTGRYLCRDMVCMSFLTYVVSVYFKIKIKTKQL